MIYLFQWHPPYRVRKIVHLRRYFSHRVFSSSQQKEEEVFSESRVDRGGRSQTNSAGKYLSSNREWKCKERKKKQRKREETQKGTKEGEG